MVFFHDINFINIGVKEILMKGPVFYASKKLDNFAFAVRGRKTAFAGERYRVRLHCWAGKLWEARGTWDQVTAMMKEHEINPTAFDLLEQVSEELRGRRKNSGIFERLSQMKLRCIRAIGPDVRTAEEICKATGIGEVEVAGILSYLIDKNLVDWYVHEKKVKVFLTEKGVELRGGLGRDPGESGVVPKSSSG